MGEGKKNGRERERGERKREREREDLTKSKDLNDHYTYRHSNTEDWCRIANTL